MSLTTCILTFVCVSNIEQTPKFQEELFEICPQWKIAHEALEINWNESFFSKRASTPIEWEDAMKEISIRYPDEVFGIKLDDDNMGAYGYYYKNGLRHHTESYYGFLWQPFDPSKLVNE